MVAVLLTRAEIDRRILEYRKAMLDAQLLEEHQLVTEAERHIDRLLDLRARLNR